MGTMASQITSLTIVYSTGNSGASKKTSKLRVIGLCEGNSSVTGEFPAQRTRNAENVFIWWNHHDMHTIIITLFYEGEEKHVKPNCLILNYRRRNVFNHSVHFVQVNHKSLLESSAAGDNATVSANQGWQRIRIRVTECLLINMDFTQTMTTGYLVSHQIWNFECAPWVVSPFFPILVAYHISRLLPVV